MKLPAVEPRRFREALGQYPSGVTIITAMAAGVPVGFTCQSFFSVSIDPPLVSFSVMKSSSSWPKLRAAGRCAINILSSEQASLSDSFGRSSVDRWANVKWAPSSSGNPLIESAITWLDCSLYAEHEAGDHTIVICRVERISEPPRAHDPSPLVYFKGKYRELAPSMGVLQSPGGA